MLFWSQLQHSTLLPLLFLLSAMLMAWYAPSERALKVWQWFSDYALLLSASYRQQSLTTAAILSQGSCIGLGIAAVAIVMCLIPTFAAYPWFFEIILLYLCCNLGRSFALSKAMAQLLRQGHQQAVRLQLQTWVAFNTQHLSRVGIAKAILEKQYRDSLMVISISLAYLGFGLFAALFVRLLWQLLQIWPPLTPFYPNLAAPVFRCGQLVFYIPSLVFRSLLWGVASNSIPKQQQGLFLQVLKT